jgi:hypothetical protein
MSRSYIHMIIRNISGIRFIDTVQYFIHTPCQPTGLSPSAHPPHLAVQQAGIPQQRERNNQFLATIIVKIFPNSSHLLNPSPPLPSPSLVQ